MPLLIALEALVLITFSAVAVFPVWVAMMAIWFAMYALIRIATRFGLVDELTSKNKRIHIIGVTVFPLIATIWKYSQQHFSLDDGGLPNRIQHFVWAASMVGVLLPLLTMWWKNRRPWEQIVMAVALVAVIGNATEVMEYGLKFSKLQANPIWAADILLDTIADICVNVAGAFVAAIAVGKMAGSFHVVARPRHLVGFPKRRS